MSDFEEAEIYINGQKLTFAQSLTVRVAVGSFSSECQELSELSDGKIFKNYSDRIHEINLLLFQKKVIENE